MITAALSGASGMTVFPNSSALSVDCDSASKPPDDRSSVLASPVPSVVFPVPLTGVREDAEMTIRKSFVGGVQTFSNHFR